MYSTSAPSATPQTLEQVKEQFSIWRETRTKHGKIPSSLWESVNYLVKEQGHSLSELSIALGVNYEQIRRNVNLQNLQNKPPSTTPDFIKVSLPSSGFFVSPQSSSVEQKTFCHYDIEITRPDGAIFKASGLDHKSFCSLVQSFLGS